MHNLVLMCLVSLLVGFAVVSMAQDIMMFMLTGRISSTDIVVPVWGMYALYGGIACIVLLSYLISYELDARYRKQRAALPRRRYGHI